MVDYEDTRLDTVFAALADPTRRAMIERLARGEATVGALAAPFDLTVAAVSKHLNVLERAGLVAKRRDGRQVRCAIRPEALKDAAGWVELHQRYWAERLADLERYFTDATGAGPRQED